MILDMMLVVAVRECAEKLEVTYGVKVQKMEEEREFTKTMRRILRHGQHKFGEAGVNTTAYMAYAAMRFDLDHTDVVACIF